MTEANFTKGDLKRRDVVLRFGAACATSVALSVIALVSKSSPDMGSSKSGKVFPQLTQTLSQAVRLEIVTPRSRMELVKSDTDWVMTTADGYRVAEEPLRQVIKALKDLRFIRGFMPPEHVTRTQTDPRTGGSGLWLSLEAADDSSLARLILVQSGDRSLVQIPNDPSLYEVNAVEWPNLARPSSWLDLPKLDFSPDRIATISLRRPGQPELDIVRRPDGGFAPVGGQANALATDIALLITRLELLDVRQASKLAGPAYWTHSTRLKSGLNLVAKGYEADGRYWVKLLMDTQQATTQEEGNRLAAQTRNWAFEIPAKVWALVTTPTSILVQSGG